MYILLCMVSHANMIAQIGSEKGVADTTIHTLAYPSLAFVLCSKGKLLKRSNSCMYVLLLSQTLVYTLVALAISLTRTRYPPFVRVT